MCSRYLLTQEHLRAILLKLGVPVPTEIPGTRYNLPPGGPIPTVRTQPGERGAKRGAKRGREAALLRWGLVPAWANSPDGGLINARAESAAEKPSFREALRHRRCLIPVSGFYEWQAIGRTRQPWVFQRADQAPFTLAGVWETWTAPDGTQLESCALLTTEPNATMAPIHSRMPVVLDETAWGEWLDPDRTDSTALAPLLRPCPDATLTARAVTPRVNRVDFDHPACLDSVAPHERTTEENQLGLGLL